MITCFMGVIGSGKDYRADLAVAGGAVRVDFKDGLIDMVNDIVGYDIRPEYDWFKQAIVGFRMPSVPAQQSILTSIMNEIKAAQPDVMTGRKLLQNVGTDAIRKRDPDYWIKQFVRTASERLREGHTLVNADCRFPNEIMALNRMQCHVNFVFCDYRSRRYDPRNPHASEHMAQQLLAMGLKDGEYLSPRHVANAAVGF